MVEQVAVNHEVVGSNPTRGANLNYFSNLNKVAGQWRLKKDLIDKWLEEGSLIKGIKKYAK